MEPPRFPQEFPADAVSLRRDCGPDERLAPGEPDAVLAGDELYLFGLPEGGRRLALREIHAVRSRSRVLFGPWRLVAAMLALLGLTAVIWLAPLSNLARMLLGAGLVLVSLLVLYLRRDADRVRHRLEVLPALGGKLILELPEKVPGRAVDRFAALVQRRLAEG